jgi:BRCT domain type II-containing protein
MDPSEDFIMNIKPNALLGLHIVLTGRTLGLPRHVVADAIHKAGGIVQDEVDFRTDIVVASNPNRATKKQQAAIAQRKPLIDDAQFRDIVDGVLDAHAVIRSARAGQGLPPTIPPPASTPTPAKPAFDLSAALGSVAIDDPFAAAF